MFFTTHDHAMSKWRYLVLALGLLMLGVGPIALLTLHARVKPKR